MADEQYAEESWWMKTITITTTITSTITSTSLSGSDLRLKKRLWVMGYRNRTYGIFILL